MPAQNTRGERVPGKNPTPRTVIVKGFQVRPASAASISSIRFSGISPINFSVM